MGYKWTSRIGFHQVDPDRILCIPDLIDFFQDTGGFHGADCGYSNKQMADMGLTWIIASWQVLVNDLPLLDDHVVVETYPFSFKYFMAHRHYIMRSPDGHEYVRANSLWLLMDLNKYSPVKIPEELKAAYGKCEDQTDGYDFGDRKILSPSGGSACAPVIPDHYMIDTNGHVNNKEYIRIASCLLPKDTDWNFFRVEYTEQAKEGDKMIPVISVEKDRTCVALKSEDDRQFFISEWTRR